MASAFRAWTSNLYTLMWLNFALNWDCTFSVLYLELTGSHVWLASENPACRCYWVMFTGTQVDRFYMSKYETSVGWRKLDWVRIQHDINKPITGHNTVLHPHSWSSKWLLTWKYPFEILCPYAFSDLVYFVVFSEKAVAGKSSLVLSTLYRVLVCTDLHLFLHSIALVNAQDLLKTAYISLVQHLFLLCP